MPEYEASDGLSSIKENESAETGTDNAEPFEPGGAPHSDTSADGSDTPARSILRRRFSRRKPVPDYVPNYPLSGPGSRKRYLLFCFLAPFLLLLAGFIYQGIYPFGDRQILIMDAWHQYFPFFEELHTRLRSGDSLFYSFTTGMGTNFIALFAYYLASPLNLLALLVPTAYLREIYALITLLKVGLAGLFCGIYLYRVFKRNDLTLPMFSVCFALCSFMMGYYWNIMWLDTVMLLPLLALGIHSLVTEGRFRLYTLILALSVAANYYIGFIVCIFTAIYFFVLCIVCRIGFRKFLLRFGEIALFSVLGLLMTAPITFTAYEALMRAYYVPEQFDDAVKLYHSFREIITQVLAFIPPTYSDGLPNLYCGFFCFLLLYVFLRARGIRIREKILYLLFLAFLIVSCNVNLLNYIWHGLHYPNMLPYRFSFLFCFLLVVMAYKAFRFLSELRWFDLIIMFAMYLVFLIYSVPILETYELGNLIAAGNFIAFAVYFVILAVYLLKRVDRRKINIAISAVILVEFSIYMIITAEQVGSSSRSSYINKEEEMSVFLEAIEENDEEAFYRTEFSTWYILNAAPLYDYNGVAQFSSTANSGVSWLLESLGLPSSPSGNRFTYGATSPVANAFINLKYMLSSNNTLKDTYAYELMNSIDNTAVFRTTSYLPLGFMVNEDVDTLKTNALTPFDRQNEWIREQTGIREDVYIRIPIETVGHSNLYVPILTDARYAYVPKSAGSSGRLKFNYRMPKTGQAFAYFDLPGHSFVTLLQDNEEDSAVEIPLDGAGVLSLGEIEEDVLISLRAQTIQGESGFVNSCVYLLNQEAYEKALQTLTPEEILTISPDYYPDITIADNPLEFQNRLLQLASGVEGDAFTQLIPESVSYEHMRFFYSDSGIYGFESSSASEQASLRVTLTMPRDGSLYTMVNIDKADSDEITVSCGEEETTYNIRYPYVIAMGTYEEGDLVTISVTLEEDSSGGIHIRPYILDEQVFESALHELANEPLTLIQMEESLIEGTVTARKDGYLYTSIPYEDGWSAYVDGEKTDTVPLGDDGFILIPVTAGTHTITLRYLPSGFLPGCAAFAGAAAVFLTICILTRHKKFETAESSKKRTKGE